MSLKTEVPKNLFHNLDSLDCQVFDQDQRSCVWNETASVSVKFSRYIVREDLKSMFMKSFELEDQMETKFFPIFSFSGLSNAKAWECDFRVTHAVTVCFRLVFRWKESTRKLLRKLSLKDRLS